MKSFIIEWNSLRNGEFPITEVQNCGLNVHIEKKKIFQESITISSPTDELIDTDTVFVLGMLVQSLKKN